jgi:septal ring factor EnvC (AmiA/AmiB activator)
MYAESRRPFVLALRAMAAASGICLLALASVSAQTPPKPTKPGAIPNLDAIKQRDKELEAVRSEQRKVLENEARLKREIDSIGDDRRKLNQQLIDTAARVRAVEDRIAKADARMAPLAEREQKLRASLQERRAVMTEVLAALQRIGRNPPPAIVIRPEDALESVRSAIMLGAVLPDMRQQAEALARDIGELVKVRNDIATERDAQTRDLATIDEDRKRLSLLVDQRKKQQAEVEKALAAERQKAAILGRTAGDLKDLIAKLEQSLDPTTRQARQVARTSTEVVTRDARPDLAALKDPTRLAPAIPFVQAKGILPLPVNGVRLREFGAPDGLGGLEKGLSIATRAGAQVTAPCDGWVVYAAAFRNYGQVLILNAGDGYHVVLAGMDRISVNVGQFVLTGEPVAVMGTGSQGTAGPAPASNRPALYVEFRKDGTPVDPGPWWAASEGEKVRG